MTRTVWSEEMVNSIKPELVAPLVCALCSETPPTSGQLYEAGSGAFMAYRWQRARGVDFEHEKGVPEVEEVAKVRPTPYLSLSVNPPSVVADYSAGLQPNH